MPEINDTVITIKAKQIIEFTKDLKTFAHRAYPFATKNTLNQGVFFAQKLARKNIQQKMVLRNKHTIQSIRVDQTRTLNVSQQRSVVGSTAPYMVDQEFGVTITKTGKRGVSIPTGYSAGQEGQQRRTKLPRRPNKMANITLSGRRRKSKSKKQRILFAVQDAVKSGNRYTYIDLGRRQGIFKVVGGRKGFKRGWPKGAKLKMVHDLTQQSVRIDPTPWLKPAVDNTAVIMPDIHLKSLVFQLKKHNLFRP